MLRGGGASQSFEALRWGHYPKKVEKHCIRPMYTTESWSTEKKKKCGENGKQK